jgi:class 3 adenylate cyclase
MGVIKRKNLDQPDEVRSFPKMTGHLVQVGSLAVGRGVLEPGWRWSTHVGPAAGTTSCQVHHVQLLLAGRFAVRLDDGEEAEFGPNDVFDLPAGHDAWVVGDEPVVIVDVFGNAPDIGLHGERQRVVTTILMSDIVESTATANRLGDTRWKQLLADHDRSVRTRFEKFGGHEVNTTGDGFVATFPSAVGALRCAASIRDAVRAMGIEVRIGVHTGEVELLPDDVRGVAVHAAARIMALGGPSEVLASAVTRGLAEGSGLRLMGRGSYEVKGFERPIEVYQLES